VSGVPPPPQPIPPEAFGWVWSKWVELLRQLSAAEDRARAAEPGPFAVAAGNAVDLARYDLSKFRAETADGLKLALRFLAESDPAALYGVVSAAIRDAADQRAEEHRDDTVFRLRKVEAENARLRAEVAELSAGVRAVLDELGVMEAAT
jgi:hypothetical protein